MPTEIKVFSDLQKEVIEKGVCGKCGGCYSFCSAGELNAIQIGNNELPTYSDESNCVKCGICHLICPQTTTLNQDLKQKFGWEAPLGIARDITSARTTDSTIARVCTDGGVVTALLTYLLDQALIEGAIVSKKIDPITRKAVLAFTRSEIISAAGSGYAGASHLEELGGQFTTYSPILPEVKGLASRYLRHIAVVGTPCQISTIRKMQCLGILPAHLIEYTIGLFCIENFSFTESARRAIETKYHFQFANIQKINIKDKFIISVPERTIRIPLDEVEAFARPACLACNDFSNEYADISVGGLGSPDGYTTTIIRSEKGEKLYQSAIDDGYIKEADQQPKDRARIRQQILTFSKSKRIRAQNQIATLGG
ncbi:MAG: Coenzyme F420 hydrogenase/dehydrogenase, beta subunit C-terminal domain [Candidatus Bathyarchaeota archaeon]|nr:Coenzyme F420 hydrogenase/dehydrogenase, beta subunit C-terminal domain [Candidatus Bathyarchaeota archaeon]